MLPMFLLPETVARQDGMGPEVALDCSAGNLAKIVRLTLGITRIIAQESLEVSLWGSSDGARWRPLLHFPQKFYCGTYASVIDLARHPDVRHLRTQWRMGRWLPQERAPLFGFYLFAEEGRLQRQAGAA